MTTFTLSPKLLGFLISTRAALAFGVGLLAASRLPEPQRRRVALTLIALGAATTIPAARSLFRARNSNSDAALEEGVGVPVAIESSAR
jgi:hypothetical protein